VKKNIFIKCLAYILLCIMIMSAPVPCEAAAIPEERQLPRLWDDADILSDAEEKELTEQLDEISERQSFDVVVVTVGSLEGKSAQSYADDFYDYNGYGMGAADDGALLLVSMTTREWHISTNGFGITALTDAGINYIADAFVPYLSDGAYADAFAVYADLCDAFVTEAKEGEAYDVNHMPKEKQPHPLGAFIIALVLGFVLAFLPMWGMKRQLKSVRAQSMATSYEKAGSRNITLKRDIFLYHTISRRPKPKDQSSGGSSIHTSSSGRSHGGGGGRF